METTSYTANNSTTTTSVSSSGPGIGFDRTYLTSVQGILNAVIVASGFCLAVSAAVPPVLWNGTSVAAFSSFVGWEIFVFFLVIYLFYMLRIIPKLPGPMGLVILVYMLVNLLFLFISIILCGIAVSELSGPPGAAMAFGLVAFGCHLGLGFLLFQKWRTTGHHFHKGECGHTFSMATVTTTTTAGAADQQARY